jgi:hypothetical protein
MASKEQRALNEALFRSLNERVTEIGDDLDTAPVGAPTGDYEEFFCECGGLECMARIQMSRAEYEAVRAHPARFFTLESHADPEVERIVERTARYAVVEKLPGEAGIALETDTRDE